MQNTRLRKQRRRHRKLFALRSTIVSKENKKQSLQSWGVCQFRSAWASYRRVVVHHYCMMRLKDPRPNSGSALAIFFIYSGHARRLPTSFCLDKHTTHLPLTLCRSVPYMYVRDYTSEGACLNVKLPAPQEVWPFVPPLANYKHYILRVFCFAELFVAF